MALQDSLDQALLARVFLVSLLIVGEGGVSCLGFDTLVDADSCFWIDLTRCLSLSLLLMNNLHLITLCLNPLLLLHWPHRGNNTLIILEVSTIQSLKSWNPNGKPCAELRVPNLI